MLKYLNILFSIFTIEKYNYVILEFENTCYKYIMFKENTLKKLKRYE